MTAWEGQKTLGIVGGGQLGRMLTLAALPLGFRVIVLDPGEHCPAAQVGAKQIKADFYDAKALRQLVEAADYITIEIEHIDAKALEKLLSLDKPINPAPTTIQLIQDKLQQKLFLSEHGIDVAPFVAIHSKADALSALKLFGGKMLLKARQGGYDGRGNMVIASPNDLDEALDHFKEAPLYAEAFVPFTKELAIMVARSTSGEVAAYPVAETIHARNICLEVLAPAPVNDDTRKKAEELVLKVAGLLDGAGMFGIEMFLSQKGEVLVNEIAPRVHNSGHFTMNACATSQFEQHIRAVTGLPLGSTGMIVPAAVMINILGERDGPTKVEGLAEALAIPGVAVHLYGKSPTKIDRKMGHINATGSTLKEAKKRAEQARKLLNI